MEKDKREDLSKAEKCVVKNLVKFWELSGERTLAEYQDKVKVWPSNAEDREITASDFHDHFTSAQVLVLTANSIESNLLVRLLFQETGYPLPTFVADNCVYRFGIISGLNVVHLQPQSISSHTKEGAGNALDGALKRFTPKLVVSLGVAFGINPERQHVGDVLVSKYICAYDAKNKRTDGSFALSKDAFFESDSRLMGGWMSPLSCEAFPTDDSRVSFHWYCDTILSGGTVLSDVEERDMLAGEVKSKGYDVIGGEMEGNGVYYECRKEDIPCVVIKGICDWGALKNGWDYVWKYLEKTTEKQESIDYEKDSDTIKDCIQALATTNAFHALKYLLSFDKNVILIEKSELVPIKGTVMRNSLRRARHVLLGEDCSVLVFGFVTEILLLAAGIIYRFEFGATIPPWVWIAMVCVLLLGLVSFLTIVILYRKHRLSKPESLLIQFADIRIFYLSFRNCCCFFKNIGEKTLQNATIAWLSKKQYAPVHIYPKTNLPVQEGICANSFGLQIGINHFEPFMVQDDTPVIPDTLQIEYDWNGKRIYHTINCLRLRNGSIMSYTEHIFMQKNGKYQEMYCRKCCIKNGDKSLKRTE